MPEWKSGRIRMGDEWKSGLCEKVGWVKIHNLDPVSQFGPSCWAFGLHCSQRLILYLNNLFYFWQALSNPSVPCQALTKIWQKTKYKGFAKVKVIPLKPHLIKNSSSRPLSGGCHQTWQKNPTKNWLKLPPPPHHTSHLFTLTFFRADNWYMFVFTASA